MVLWLAEHNNVPQEYLDVIGISWKQLHEERRKVEETGLTYDMLVRNYWAAIGECEE